MEEINFGEIMEGIFKERLKVFLGPFPHNDGVDLLTGVYVGLKKIIGELPFYKEIFSEGTYLQVQNALKKRLARVEMKLKELEADKDEEIKRKIKIGEIKTHSWL